MGETPGKMYALATVLILLAATAVLLRLYARKIKKASLAWDDYMILFAMLSTIGTALCMFVGTALGNLGRHTKIAPDGSPVFNHQLEINYASLMTSTLTFGLTKLSVLLLYKRIFRGALFLAFVWTMITVIVIWTVAFFFANMLQCYPISENWTGLGGSADACIDENMMYLGQAFSDAITDLIILAMPIPCICALQLPTKQKLGVIGMFLLGILTIAASVTKLVFFYKIAVESNSGDEDFTYLFTPTLYWPMVESSLGIVGACLPLFRPVISKLSPVRSIREIISFPSMSITSSKKASTDARKLEDGDSSSSAVSSADSIYAGGDRDDGRYFHRDLQVFVPRETGEVGDVGTKRNAVEERYHAGAPKGYI
ncbi:MAG: hypothetical protein ALECFALPRED_008288 [Alectoria fallacina]|uniref:Rhodopsin domain-containing protein n=1 Tax=Alectoria fallacina TaxID=1903189 RepID=A0A8H3J311_9LECA|nr:MAG: hypothetical protein ALECFALPRED_008288 [Alectoria fallacina]